MVLLGLERHGQCNHNNKVVKYQQYFEKEVRDKFDFLNEDKHQRFQQADTITFTGHS